MNEYDQDLEKAENQLLSEDDVGESPPSDIVAFNELRSCSDLVRMKEKNQLDIQPDFQRDVVWSNSSKTRFIDSLVKQLPIPSMCLSLDYKTDKRLMIDGLQRISSIIQFLTDDDWRLSSLDDVEKKISGKTVSHIKEKHPEIFSRVENLTIPVTVLRCDYSKTNHMNYLFTIFHRLNTGGNKLSNQEIRNCIFQSRFNDLLKEVVNHLTTIELFSIEKNKTYRFSFEETFLRVFAFSTNLKSYRGRLAQFLNDFMDQKKKSFPEQEENEFRTKIYLTLDLLYDKILDGEQLPRISKATTEAILVGIFSNIQKLKNDPDEVLKEKFSNLRADPVFSAENLKEGLSSKEKLTERINRGIEIFS